jgi:hypothetical protein
MGCRYQELQGAHMELMRTHANSDVTSGKLNKCRTTIKTQEEVRA